MDVIDRLNLSMKQLKEMGVDVRLEDLKGAPSGLCKIGNRKVLLVEVSLRSLEQLECFEQTISRLRAMKNAAA